MLVWSWTHLTFASHIKDLQTFSLVFFGDIFFTVSGILIAGLPLVIFSCCLWLFSICSPSCFSVHLQKVWLFPFFKYHKNVQPAPIFWPWFSTSCPKSLRQVVGDWAARVGSVGSRRFSMRARSTDRETAAPQIERHNPARNTTTQQHNITRPTTQHNTTTTTTTQHNLAPHIERHNPAGLMQRGETSKKMCGQN